MDLNQAFDDDIVNEEELFAPIEPIAPLSPIGPLEFGDNLDNFDDNNEDQGNQRGNKKGKNDEDKEKKPRKPGVYMNVDRLGGERGVIELPKYFSGVKFRGKGHEKENLDKLLGVFEEWSQNMFPKFQFNDVVKKIEGFPAKRVQSIIRYSREKLEEEEARENNEEKNDQNQVENNGDHDGGTQNNNETRNNSRDEIIIDDDFEEIDFDDMDTDVLL